MQSTTPDPEPLLPLSPATFYILLTLAAGEHHGYGIMQEIRAQTKGKLNIGPGTLYRSIKNLLAEGLIIEADERPDPTINDERRRYYRLTDFGSRVAAAEAQRLVEIVDLARTRQLLPNNGQFLIGGELYA